MRCVHYAWYAWQRPSYLDVRRGNELVSWHSKASWLYLFFLSGQLWAGDMECVPDEEGNPRGQLGHQVSDQLGHAVGRCQQVVSRCVQPGLWMEELWLG